jgi:hypothetical protein
MALRDPASADFSSPAGKIPELGARTSSARS